MRIDFYSTYAEVDAEGLRGKTVVVIDVLRATSVMVSALANGSEAVLPVKSIAEARSLARKFEPGKALLAGERDGLPIPGFDLGNSPPLYTPRAVRGKTILLTTMNGTRALNRCSTAGRTYIGSFLNARSVVDRLVAEARPAVLLCSGMYRRFTLDDGLCAGLLLSRISDRVEIDAGDLARSMLALYEKNSEDLSGLLSEHCYGYRYLQMLGCAEDLEFCLRTDSFDMLPVFRKGRVSL